MLHVTYVSGKKVTKVIGVVNHVTNRGRYNFMLSTCTSVEDKCGVKNSNKLDNIYQVMALRRKRTSLQISKHRGIELDD